MEGLHDIVAVLHRQRVKPLTNIENLCPYCHSNNVYVTNIVIIAEEEEVITVSYHCKKCEKSWVKTYKAFKVIQRG